MGHRHETRVDDLLDVLLEPVEFVPVPPIAVGESAVVQERQDPCHAGVDGCDYGLRGNL